MLSSIVLSLSVLSSAWAQTVTTIPAPNAPVTVSLNGVNYVFKEMVAYGFIAAETIDQFGDSLGGIGSAINVKQFRQNSDGSYAGRIVAQPDRGHNTVMLENYAARMQLIDFVLKPCTTGATQCNTDPANPSLTLNYLGGLRYTDTSPRNQNQGFTSGLDSTNSRPASGLFPILPEANNGALATDMEGIALAADGSFWSSDEYGPSIYHIAANGEILSAIDPPDAFLPHLADGTLSFSTTGTAPTYGRVPNQGFEGLTISPDNTRLYALLQSALSQDQILANANRRYTRMLVYDISTPSAPSLIEEYVVELPQQGTGSKPTVFAQSELLYVSPGVFLTLARDGKGNGNGNSPSSTATTSQLTSVFKNAGLISITSATNILGRYDGIMDSVAPNGVLRTGITPATFNEFVNFIDPNQLARFGLQNGPTPLATDIVGKWESLALQPVLDPLYPNDYFLFSMADNDFINTNEYFMGMSQGADPYGTSVPNAMFVFRVTLPGAQVPSYLQAQSPANPSGLARVRRSRFTCGRGKSECELGGLNRVECVDTQSDLEQCGECAEQGGVDCSALPGVAGIECIRGECVASSCDHGFILSEDGICV